MSCGKLPCCKLPARRMYVVEQVSQFMRGRADFLPQIFRINQLRNFDVYFYRVAAECPNPNLYGVTVFGIRYGNGERRAVYLFANFVEQFYNVRVGSLRCVDGINERFRFLCVKSIREVLCFKVFRLYCIFPRFCRCRLRGDILRPGSVRPGSEPTEHSEPIART